MHSSARTDPSPNIPFGHEASYWFFCRRLSSRLPTFLRPKIDCLPSAITPRRCCRKKASSSLRCCTAERLLASRAANPIAFRLKKIPRPQLRYLFRTVSLVIQRVPAPPSKRALNPAAISSLTSVASSRSPRSSRHPRRPCEERLAMQTASHRQSLCPRLRSSRLQNPSRRSETMATKCMQPKQT